MRAHSLLPPFVLLVHVSACANPRCPPGEVKHIDTCVRVSSPDAGDDDEPNDEVVEGTTARVDAGSDATFPDQPFVPTMDAAIAPDGGGFRAPSVTPIVMVTGQAPECRSRA